MFRLDRRRASLHKFRKLHDSFYSAKAEKYLGNPYFQIKMTLLLLIIIHAIVFRRSVYKNTEELDRAPQIPGRVKAAAILSMVMWIGVVAAGRWIAYYEPPKPTVAATELLQR